MSNRADRRAAGLKNVKQKTYTLTLAEIQKIKADAVDAAVEKALLAAAAFSALILHDHFGFGKDRLNRFSDHWLTWTKSWIEGEIGQEEAVKALEEYTDLSVTGLKERGKGLW